MDLSKTLEFELDEVMNAKELVESSKSERPMRKELLKTLETQIEVLKATIPHTQAAEIPDDVIQETFSIDDLDYILLSKMLEVLSDGDEIPILRGENHGKHKSV